MTEFQKTQIQAPATGLMIYQTNGTQPGFWYFNGTLWVQAVGPQGATGAQGIAGATGAQGITGATVAAGTIAPGSNGQTLRYDISSNAWVANSNLYNTSLFLIIINVLK